MGIYEDLDIPPPRASQISKAQSDKPASYGVASRGAGKPYQVRNTDKVNEHVARMFIAYRMDTEAAVSKMLPPDVSESHVRMLAQTLEQRPGVKKWLQQIYGELGLTDESQKVAIAMLWEVAIDKKSKHWPAAMKMLSDIFGWSKKADESDKPVTLVFKGYEDDVKRMFDGNLPDTTPAKSRPAILEDEESVQ